MVTGIQTVIHVLWLLPVEGNIVSYRFEDFGMFVCVHVMCVCCIYYAKGWLCRYLPNLVLWATTGGRICGRRTFCHSCQHIVGGEMHRDGEKGRSQNWTDFVGDYWYESLRWIENGELDVCLLRSVNVYEGEWTVGNLWHILTHGSANVIGGVPRVCLCYDIAVCCRLGQRFFFSFSLLLQFWSCDIWDLS